MATHSPSAFSSIPLAKCSLPRHESTDGGGRGAGGCRGSLHAGQPICPCVMVLSSPAFPLPAMENPLAGAGAGPEQGRAGEERARHKREQRPHLPHKRGPKCARPGEKERRGWREKGNGGGEANPHSCVCGSHGQGRAGQEPMGARSHSTRDKDRHKPRDWPGVSVVGACSRDQGTPTVWPGMSSSSP